MTKIESNMKLLFRQKNILLSVFLIMISHSLISQTSGNMPNEFWKHVRFGGGIGVSFGDRFFSGTLTPSAIYEFNPQFALGVGLNGTYNSQKNFYKSTIFGGSILGFYNPITEFQLSGEFEELNVSRNWEDNLGIADENYWYPALFFGVGYSTQNVTIGIRYDLLYDRDKSIYADPWMPFIRVFF